MKLRYLYLLPLLGAALMGCDEIEYSDAKPIENPQLPEITFDDFTVTPAEALVEGLDLTTLAEEVEDPDNYMIKLYTVSTNTDLIGEEGELKGGLILSIGVDSPEFNIDNVVMEDNVAYAPLSSFLYTRSMMFGKDPRQYTVYYEVPLYLTVNGSTFKLGLKNQNYLQGNFFPETGVDPGYVVEDAYYLLGTNGTALSSAVKFDHSGYNVYDDAIFTVTAKFTQGNTWLVVPLSVYESGTLDTAKCYGPEDAKALEGVLELGGSAGQVTEGNKYTITINLAELSYTVHEIADFEYLYTPGNSNDWNFDACQLLFTDDFVRYNGFAYLLDSFKLVNMPTWDGSLNWGGSVNETAEGGISTGALVANGDNIGVETEGLYWLSTNMDALTFNMQLINTVAIIGDFNGWGDEGQVYMDSEDYLIWTATLEDNGNGWKFRMYNDKASSDTWWAVNLGGPADELALNGANIELPAGKYTITLDLSKLPYTYTYTAAN
ncbi:MAG: hypothetical protein J1F12_01210 [Muribaculaceae bacterium]|nr:hypothetical protein [Muribaculaceae bacterium]